MQGNINCAVVRFAHLDVSDLITRGLIYRTADSGNVLMECEKGGFPTVPVAIAPIITSGQKASDSRCGIER